VTVIFSIFFSVKMKYQYMPIDAAPLLCPNPHVPSPAASPGSMSIWSYMTAAIVASTVAANLVNNVNSNNNNNNNNNNQDNQNNNNMNMNAAENSNMNMNMIMPGGRRSFEAGLLESVLHNFLQEENNGGNGKRKFWRKLMATFAAFTLMQYSHDFFPEKMEKLLTS
jgi:hypothetical protein